LGRLTPVQRQVHDPLLVDHLRNGIFAGFHHGRRSRHFHVLGNRPEFHRGIHLYVVSDLQQNAGLDVTLESWRADFKFVRTYRKVRQHVSPLRVRYGAANQLFVRFGAPGLRHGNSLAEAAGE
jgi:hypothetical protein